MYINYVLIFRKLEECYDQIVHPQKRRLVRHILDGTMGRLVGAWDVNMLRCHLNRILLYSFSETALCTL